MTEENIRRNLARNRTVKIHPNNIQNAIYYWMEGIDICKNRVENVYEIIHHYRSREKYETANYYYKIALEVD